MALPFHTTNIDLAAYLFARAYPLLEIRRFDKLTIFSFPSEAALSAEAFYNGATVSAKNLLYAAHILESMKEKEQYGYIT
jgi:hypothetical protein